MRKLIRMTVMVIGLSIVALAAVLAGIYYWTVYQDYRAARATYGDGLDVIKGVRVSVSPWQDGLERPSYIGHAGDGSGRLFVNELKGNIYLIENGERQETPFLAVPPERILNGGEPLGFGENGLLSFAFHPDFAENGHVFVYVVNQDGAAEVLRYTVDANNPDVVDVGTETSLLTIPRETIIHYGGQLAFGPDGYLYIGVGDGAHGGDTGDNAQRLSTLNGAILRIDVDTPSEELPYSIPEDNPFLDDPDAMPEVWAYGLRNPWRFLFDDVRGGMFIVDPGDTSFEELNYVPVASSGYNFGWAFFEGNMRKEHVLDDTVLNASTYSQPIPDDLIAPIATYDHTGNNCSIAGGAVYRGEAAPELDGVYFYGDYCSGRMWATWQDDNGNWQTQFLMQLDLNVTHVSGGENGELYIVDISGTVSHVVLEDA